MDILFFAAVAFYVFWKLREQFGKVDEGEKKQIDEKISRKKEIIEAVQSQVMTVQKKLAEQNEAQKQINEKIISTLEAGYQDHFRKILTACNISAEFFLNGTKSTFEMVLKAFSSADLQGLKLLLSDKVYAGFEQAINQIKSEEKTLVNNLISVDKAEIVSVSLLNNTALVVIKFVSNQINYIADKTGQIIEGRKDEIKELTDVWTFKKDIVANNKNWVISSTQN
jgi:predicted lipid-binding transport protein (Tim44 family)